MLERVVRRVWQTQTASFGYFAIQKEDAMNTPIARAL
jgi:hypothetical protein